MFIFLDPRSQDQVVVGISSEANKPRFFVYQRNDRISLLEFITKKLKPITYNPKAIVVVPGPGGFSNVRSAATVANALGFALQIHVVAMKPKVGESHEQAFKRGIIRAQRAKSGKPVQPIYGREPNITPPSH